MCDAVILIIIEDFLGKMHNKIMVIHTGDVEPTVVTGSMNWLVSGDNKNDNNPVIVNDQGTAQTYFITFQELYNALCPEMICLPTPQDNLFLPMVRNGQAVALYAIQLASIVYNPDGSDLEKEHVVIGNWGNVSAEMTG